MLTPTAHMLYICLFADGIVLICIFLFPYTSLIFCDKFPFSIRIPFALAVNLLYASNLLWSLIGNWPHRILLKRGYRTLSRRPWRRVWKAIWPFLIRRQRPHDSLKTVKNHDELWVFFDQVTVIICPLQNGNSFLAVLGHRAATLCPVAIKHTQ